MSTFQRYKDHKGTSAKEDHKLFFSAKDPPLAVAPGDKPLVEYVVPSYLHILLKAGLIHYNWMEILVGAIDSCLLSNSTSISWGEVTKGEFTKALAAKAESLGIVKVQYHGGALIGNHCNRLFKKDASDQLVLTIRAGIERLSVNAREKAYEFLRFIRQCMDSYSKLHEELSTTSVVTLRERLGIQKLIEDFATKFKESENFLGSGKISPKLHVLLCHTTEFLECVPLRLGVLCEQGNEALHKENMQIFRSTVYSIKKGQLQKLLQRSLLIRLKRLH